MLSTFPNQHTMYTLACIAWIVYRKGMIYLLLLIITSCVTCVGEKRFGKSMHGLEATVHACINSFVYHTACI